MKGLEEAHLRDVHQDLKRVRQNMLNVIQKKGGNFYREGKPIKA